MIHHHKAWVKGVKACRLHMAPEALYLPLPVINGLSQHHHQQLSAAELQNDMLAETAQLKGQSTWSFSSPISHEPTGDKIGLLFCTKKNGSTVLLDYIKEKRKKQTLVNIAIAIGYAMYTYDTMDCKFLAIISGLLTCFHIPADDCAITYYLWLCMARASLERVTGAQ